MQIFFAFPNLDKSELKKILLSLIPRKAGKVALKCATITHLYKIYFFKRGKEEKDRESNRNFNIK